jgi:hypothetical protein
MDALFNVHCLGKHQERRDNRARELVPGDLSQGWSSKPLEQTEAKQETLTGQKTVSKQMVPAIADRVLERRGCSQDLTFRGKTWQSYLRTNDEPRAE